MNSIPAVVDKFEQLILPSNQQVFSQGQSCSNYIVVTSGSVKVFARSEEGKEVTLYRIKPGQICVLTTSCLMGGTKYPAEAVTESETTARLIPPEKFNQLLEESVEFRQFIFNSFSQRLTDLMIQIEQISFESIEQRLKHLLYQKQSANRVALTHQQIAMEIGSAREVVSRHLKAFEKQQLIKLHRGEIELLDSFY